MTVIRRDFNEDGLGGIIYDFTELGDSIPPHIHGRRDSHITIVTNGKFEAFVRGEEPRIVSPGKVVNYPPGIEHWCYARELDPEHLINGKPAARLVFVFRFHLPLSGLDVLSRET